MHVFLSKNPMDSILNSKIFLFFISNEQKSIRAKLVEQYPAIEPYIDAILPKKENFKLVKCKEHLELIADPAGAVQFVKVHFILII